MKGYKIILDLCGGTGAWSKPYEDAGYIVINITLPFYDILKTEFGKEIILFKGGDSKLLIINKSDVYGILAAPICTMFSKARTTAKTPRDFREGMKLVIACLNIIWECRYDHKLAFWCMENPRGFLNQFLGIPAFTFDPCEFGDPYTKRTYLWGYFNIPKKGNKVEPEFIHFKSGKRMSKMMYEASLKSKRRSKIIKSITPKGFAKAFYEANK